MASINKVIIIGNLGKDPETRYLPSGAVVTNITVATSEKYKDKTTGEPKETTEWHRVVMFEKLAEIAGQYLKKGSQVYIEGKLQTRKWQDKEGQDRYTTEIRADTMKMLGSRAGMGGANADDSGASFDEPRENRSGQKSEARPAAKPAGAPPKKPASSFDDMDDDIPF